MEKEKLLDKGRIILVVTALSEERKSVLPFLCADSLRPGRDRFDREYIIGDFKPKDGKKAWHIVLPPPTSAGNSKSAAETALSLSLGPAFIFLLGVAGGIPGKVNMFDVVVAERVYDTDAAKIDAAGEYIPRPDQHKSTSILLSRAKTLQDLGGWEQLLNPETPNEEVVVWVEPIAAGSKLIASSKSEEMDRIKKSAPRAVAIENEGFGVMQAAHEASIAALVIRGISDLIDNRPLSEEEGIDERVGPDKNKLRAARHAAAFMFAIISGLDPREVAEAAVEENEWVNVRMRWDDLKELSRGKKLALEFLGDTEIRNIIVKSGSVEVEFKTKRLVSALIYALSLEKDLLRQIFELVPDNVETNIDTSDPDVSKVFLAVHRLGSSNEADRQVGEDQIRALTSEFEFLKPLADRAMQASQSMARISSDLSSTKQSNRRIYVMLDQGFREALVELAMQKNMTLNLLVVKMLSISLVKLNRDLDMLTGFINNYGHQQSKLSVTVSNQLIQQIDVLRARLRIRSRQKILKALIGYAIEMRVAEGIEANQM